MGSETVAVTEEKSEEAGLFLCASLAVRRRPRQRIMPIVRRIPRRRPGKKPARTAGAGKGLGLVVGVEVELWAVMGALVALLVGFEDVEEDEVVVETVLDELDALFELDKTGKVVVGSVAAEMEMLLPEVEEAAAPPVVAVEVVDEGTIALTFMTHCTLFSHEKPCGQQSLPHLVNGPPKSVLCNWLSGCEEALF